MARYCGGFLNAEGGASEGASVFAKVRLEGGSGPGGEQRVLGGAGDGEEGGEDRRPGGAGEPRGA